MGKLNVKIELARTKISPLCEPILRSLPDWFGIEEAIQNYLRAADENITFLAWNNNHAVGFLTLKLHNEFSAEIYVIAVKREFRRMGIGRALVTYAENFLRSKNFKFLQVKTIAEIHPSPEYAETRKFYQAMGFYPLEVFPELWGIEYPCLMMVKNLD